jgi:hypothetical protein
MTVVLIPYPTEVFGEALRTGAGERTAAVFHSIVLTVNALAWSALWLHASNGRRLLNNELPEAQRRSSTILFVAGTGAYLVSIGDRLHKSLLVSGLPRCPGAVLRPRPNLTATRARPLRVTFGRDSTGGR